MLGTGVLALIFASCAGGDTDPVIALVGGTVIDGTGAPPREGETVLIRGGRILEVGPDVRVPPRAEVIDVAGMTVLPGLIDMHGHMYAMGSNQFDAYPALFLAGGVTTVFSPGDFDPEGMIALRDQIAAGEVMGPRILTAGPYFDADPSVVSWIEGVGSAEAVRAKFDRWKDRIDAVKVYTSLTEEMLAELVAGADAAGLRVTGHLGGATATARAIELGIDGLEHGIFAIAEIVDTSPNEPIADQYCTVAGLDLNSSGVEAAIDAIVDGGVWVTPTIVTIQSIHPEFEPPSSDWREYLTEGLRRALSEIPPYLDGDGAACLERALEKQLDFVRRVHERGGLVVTGTDPVAPAITPGYGLHAELANLVRAGFTPLEAITAATRDAAGALGLDGEFGTLEAGKEADLVIVEGDPTTDITRMGDTVWVFTDGVRHDPSALRESARGKIGLPGENSP
jgi:imidazolonepropionase-like amidohydrolase